METLIGFVLSSYLFIVLAFVVIQRRDKWVTTYPLEAGIVFTAAPIFAVFFFGAFVVGFFRGILAGWRVKKVCDNES